MLLDSVFVVIDIIFFLEMMFDYGLNKGFSSKFSDGYRQKKTLEEENGIQQLKYCEYNRQDEYNNPMRVRSHSSSFITYIRIALNRAYSVNSKQRNIFFGHLSSEKHQGVSEKNPFLGTHNVFFT